MKNVRTFTLSLILIFGFILTSKSQEIILRGLVLDQITEEAIAYSNIGFFGANKGTVSDVEGNFTLSINANEVKDLKLMVSRIGYFSEELEWGDFRNSCGFEECVLTILLKPKQLELEEFVLESENLSENRSFGGKLSGSKFAFAFNPKDRKPNENLGREVGIVVDSKKEKLLLKELQFYLANNQFGKTLFRINIRKIGKDVNEVFETINKEIFVEVKGDSKGVFTRSFSENEIYLQGRFLISVEWVDFESEEKYGILTIPSSFPFGAMYLRNSSQDKWEKVMGNPGIRVTGLVMD